MTLLVFYDDGNVRDSYWGTVNIPDEFLVGADDIKSGGLVHFFEPMDKTWTTMKSKGKGKGFEEVSADELKKDAKAKKQKAGEQPPVTSAPAPVSKRENDQKQ